MEEKVDELLEIL